MSSDHLSEAQFSVDYFGTVDAGHSKPVHNVQAWAGDKRIGQVFWNHREISGLEVDAEYRRQGVATAMWNRAHQEAEVNPRIPKPKHSKDRTTAGDSWAKAVGGRLPRRLK